MISDSEFDDAPLMARRAADHRHIDQLLGMLVDRREGLADATGSRPTVADRLLAPADRLATKRFLTEAGANVWANTRVLAGARPQRSGGVFRPARAWHTYLHHEEADPQ